MKDQNKTKKQLINELKKMRKRVTELEKSEIEYKLVEDALWESEKHYRQSVENSPNPIFSVDKKGIIQFWNRSCEHFFHCSSEEMIGKEYSQLLWDTGDFDSIKEIVRQVWCGKAQSDQEIIYKTEEGSKRYAVSRLYPIRDNSSNVLECVFANTDITERRMAEKALQESEKRFRTIFESSPLGVVLTSPEGKLIHVNKRFQEMMMYDEKELHIHFKNITHPDDVEKSLTTLKRLVNGEIHTVKIEKRYIKKDGGVIHSIINVAPIRDSKDRIKYFITTIEDITERKLAEEALRASEEKLNTWVETTKDGFFVMSPTGYYEYMNQSCAAIGGYKPDELIGKHMRKVLPARELTKAMLILKELLINKQMSTFELNLKRKDKTIVPVEFNVSVLIDEKGKVKQVLGTARDITERKREEALKEAEEKYRNIFENVPASIILIDENGEIVDINPYHVTHVGKGLTTKEDYIGKNLISHPSIVNANLSEIYKSVLEGKPFDKKDVYFPTTTGGTDGYFNVKGVPLLKDNKVIGAVTMHEDITERKQAEDRIKKEQEFTTNLIMGLKEGFAVVDENGTQILVNDELCAMTGFSKRELLKQKPPFKYWAEEDLKNINTAFEKTLKGIEGEYELIFKRKSGERFTSLVNPRKAADPDGNTIFFATVKDITERKLAEEVLESEHFKLKGYFENLPMLAYNVSLDGEIVDCNKIVVETLGYKSKKDLVGKPLINTIYAPSSRDKAKKLLLKWKKTGKLGNEELQVITKKGKIIDVLLNVDTIYDTKGKALYSISTQLDITERKCVEERILRQRALLDGINRLFLETLTCDTTEEVAHTCLVVAEELTGSKFGWIGEVNEAGRFDTIALSDPGWDACRMPESDAIMKIKDMEIRGIWGRILKDGQAQIVNDPASHPDQVGTPKGHPPLTSFLGVPMKYAGRTIGMFGLANKESGYNMADQQDMESLSGAFVEALNRKRMEGEIEKRKKYLEAVLGDTPDAIVTLDASQCLIEWNRGAEKIFGYTRSEVIGKNIDDLITLPDVKDEETVLSKRVLLGEEVLPFETVRYRKDGTPVNVMIAGSPIQIGGELHGVVAVYTDITERKLAEEASRQAGKALKVSEKKYRDVVESATDLIFMNNIHGNFTFVNTIAERMTEYSKDELIGMNYVEITHPDDIEKTRRLYEEQFKTRSKEIKFENRFVTKSGEIRWLWVHSILNMDGDYIVGWQNIGRDITERKQVEEELRKKMEQLDRANKLMVGRELKMIELKREVNTLLEKTGLPKKYSAPDEVK